MISTTAQLRDDAALSGTDTSLSTGTASPSMVAGLIHDDVLQSLGVAVLGVDLGRRLHTRMCYERALAELTGIVEALEAAVASSERIAPALHALLPRPSATRPGLRMLGEVTPATDDRTNGLPPAGPDEIVTTLSACLVQARRCRHQYDAGLGEETMRDLELLMQRLDFVSLAFRTVMGQLRELSPAPLAPQPRLVTFARRSA